MSTVLVEGWRRCPIEAGPPNLDDLIAAPQLPANISCLNAASGPRLERGQRDELEAPAEIVE
jgi:hypothetical protein